MHGTNKEAAEKHIKKAKAKEFAVKQVQPRTHSEICCGI